jgi:hypothetical protein
MTWNLNFVLGFVAGLYIIGGLAPLRIPAGHTLATEPDHWIAQGPCPPPGVPRNQTVETEDEFERARR